MSESATAAEHEQGLSAFLDARQARRILALLQGGAGKRKVLLATFYHGLDFDRGANERIGSSCKSADDVLALLRHHGAPDACHVMSNDKTLDGQVMALRSAMARTYGFGMGTFISCIPGRLGYFEAENPGERFLLRRPETARPS